MNKARLEAFTDAVIAIAATIMVLELRVPKHVSVHSLLAEWPVFLAYLISFWLIYVVWYSHHNVFMKAKVITQRTFLWNGLWLFALTLVPVCTAWVGQHPNAALPEILYSGIQLLWSVAFQLLDRQIMRDNPQARPDVSDSFGSRVRLYGGFSIAIVIAFWRPVWGLVIMGVMSFTLTLELLRAQPEARPRE